MTLSILCITKAEPHSGDFLLQMHQLARGLGAELIVGFDTSGEVKTPAIVANLEGARFFRIESDGYIESVLDPMIGVCSGDYILRLDDDERVSDAMADWLQRGEYLQADHWAFPRAWLWEGVDGRIGYVTNPPLWPDVQTRLSIAAKAGRRTQIHQASPYGTGQVAPVYLEHHLLLVRNQEERIAKAAHYDQLQPGAGSGYFLAYYVPEICFERLDVGSLAELQRYGVMA